MRIPIAIYDACVLYSAPLRDLLMHLALLDQVKARWTDDIHEEWIRNLLANRPDLQRETLERTRDLMNENAGDCLVTGYESFISEVDLPDSSDRHVLAAAIISRAELIVTFNVKHFPEDVLNRYNVAAQHPDQFVLHLLERSRDHVFQAMRNQRLSLKNPPKSARDYLETLDRVGLCKSAASLVRFEGSL